MKTRVLHVINSLAVGGAERLIVDLTPMTGCNVDVLVLKKTDSDFKKELLEKGVNVMFSETNIYNPFLLFFLIKKIKSYDIIHVHLFPSFYWVGLAKLFMFKAPELIYTEHNTTNRRRNNFLLKIADKFIYSLYDRLICISPQVNLSLSDYLSRKDIITIENGIDLKKFEDVKDYPLKEELNIKNDDIIIIQVANFRKSKDQQAVIRAMSLLPVNFNLVLVGEGENYSDCVRLSMESGVSDRVHFLGRRTNVSQLIKASDIVVLSSKWEGFGLSAVEGMVMSKPVIASDVAGLNDVVEDAGVLFEKSNEKEIVKIILRLAKDKDFYNKIAQRCYNRALNFDIESMKKKLTAIYIAMTNVTLQSSKIKNGYIC